MPKKDKGTSLAINIDITGIIEAGYAMNNLGIALTSKKGSTVLLEDMMELSEKLDIVVSKAAQGIPFLGKKYEVFHVYKWPKGTQANSSDFSKDRRLWFDIKVPKQGKIEYGFMDDDSLVPVPYKLRRRRSQTILIDKASRFEIGDRERIVPGDVRPSVIVKRPNGKDPKAIPLHLRDGTIFFKTGTNLFSQGTPDRSWRNFGPSAFSQGDKSRSLANKTITFRYGTKGQFTQLLFAFWANEVASGEKTIEWRAGLDKAMNYEFRDVKGLAAVSKPMQSSFKGKQRSTRMTYRGVRGRIPTNRILQNDTQIQRRIHRRMLNGKR